MQVDIYMWFKYARLLWDDAFTVAVTNTDFSLLERGEIFHLVKLVAAFCVGIALYKRRDQESQDSAQSQPGGEYIFNRDGIIARRFYWRL